jgi:16S rRNA (cytidine1402-2'-O)-methyltransferase
VSVAGLPVDRFAFEGFLPARAAARAARLRALAGEARALVFLESGRRLAAFLADAEAALGDRDAVVGRELTKLHEELMRGPLSTLRALVGAAPVRGEVTVVVAGAPEHAAAVPPEALDRAIRDGLAAGQGVRELSEALASRFGCARRDVYRRALRLHRDG